MATITPGYTFTAGETNVTHTKLNNLVSGAVISNIQPADLGAVLTATVGGTGGTTAVEGFDNLAPTTTEGDMIYRNATVNTRLAKGTAGQVLQMNTGATAPSWGKALPLTPTAGDILYYNGTAWVSLAKGTAEQPLKMNAAATAPEYGKAFPASPASGDILYYDGTSWVSLAKGTAAQVLAMNGTATAPEWAAAAAAGVFTSEYVSSDTLVSANSSNTFAHGLGASPKIVIIEAVCQSGDSGYSANDVLQLSLNPQNGANAGLGVLKDSTNVKLKVASAVYAMLENASNGASLDLTKWKFRVRAYV